MPRPSQDDPTTALWVGDSYTRGTGASSPSESEAMLTCNHLGWICYVDAQGGTGFVNPGKVAGYADIPTRLEDDASRYAPDVVVVDAGRNDRGQQGATAAMQATLRRVAQAWPDAELVVIAPYFMDSITPPLGTDFATAEKALTERLGGTFVDPIAAGWIPAGPEYATQVGGVHPNARGHAYIAERLALALR